MNIYEQYSNSNNKIMFFRDLRENKDKIELWKNMSNSDRKSLLSGLSIDDIKRFLFSFNSTDRKKIYEYMDKNKLKGIYKALGDDDKKEMLSAIEDRGIELTSKKEKIQSNIDKANESIREANEDIVKANLNIANARVEVNNIKQEIRNNKVMLRKATRDEKKKYKKMLKASRCSVFDKIGIIARYRANKLANITEEYKELNQVVNSLKEEANDLNNELSSKKEEIKNEKDNIKGYTDEIRDSKKLLRESIVTINNVNISIRNLNNGEKAILGRKLYGQKALNRVMKTKKVKNKSTIVSSKVDSNKSVQQVNDNVVKDIPIERVTGEVVDTKSNVNNVVNTINNVQDMGVSFYPPIPVTPTVNFTMNNKREAVNNINLQQLLMFYNTMSYFVMQEMQRQMNMQNMQSQGYSKVHSKGNVSILLLAGIIIMLLCMYFFII